MDCFLSFMASRTRDAPRCFGFYIRRKFLRTEGFKVNFIPGLCSYKFLYVWLDLLLATGALHVGVYAAQLGMLRPW